MPVVRPPKRRGSNGYPLGVDDVTRRRLRWGSALPRRAFLVALAVTCGVGLRELVTGSPIPAVAIRATSTTVAFGVGGFAEAFTRAYLTYDARHPERREAALAHLVGTDIDRDAGMAHPVAGRQSVTWTTAVGRVLTDAARYTVTVAVELNGNPVVRFLSVPVTRRPNGAMTVADLPAFVGPPASAGEARGLSGDEVKDSGLRAVVERALSNYLRGARDNLAADLAPGATLSPPTEPLRLRELVELSRTGQGRVAATVQATDRAGVAYVLRYELGVVRRDRWYVAALNPPVKEEKPS